MTEGANILVVDDDPAITGLVARLLEGEGYAVDFCSRGDDAVDAAREHHYDLVILDIMMPGTDGFEACRMIRTFSNVPVMFLSAKDEEIDQVVGLSIGADDYVSKPFRPRELVARVKARLRRSQPDEVQMPGVLAVDGIELDEVAYEARLNNEPLRLTPKEFGILAALLQAKGGTVSVKDLFEEVWGDPYDVAGGNAVMVHIRHLRKKLAAIDSSRDFIVNVWGMGYRISTTRTGRHGA